MRKRNKKLTTTILFISCILFIFMTGCISGGKSKNISENEIYPKGDLSKAKVFDIYHNEKVALLSNEATKFILQTLKNSKKELATEYDSGLAELNITFTDSVIQLVRKDDETIYYVFHNNKINAICYKISSKDLSKFISKVNS